MRDVDGSGCVVGVGYICRLKYVCVAVQESKRRVGNTKGYEKD